MIIIQSNNPCHVTRYTFKVASYAMSEKQSFDCFAWKMLVGLYEYMK